MLLALQDAPSTGGASDDIVVIANRLKTWRGTFKAHNGKLSCKTTTSTGDTAVDALGCEAMSLCLSPVAAQMEAIDKGPGKRADRQRDYSALLQSRVPCMTDARRAGIARLAAERTP